MDDSNRTIPNVVGLIKSWIPWRPEPPAYVSRDYWMPDRSCRVCYECDSQFTFFNRRHHCRLCGRIFCSKCASHWLPGPTGEPQQEWDPVRVCDYCYKQWRLQPAPMAAAVENGGQVADADHSDNTSPSTNSFVSVKSSETSDSSSGTFLSLSQSGGLSSPYQTLVMDTAAAETRSGSNDLTGDVGEDIWSEKQLGLFQDRIEYDGEEFGVSHFGSSGSPLSEVYGYFGPVQYDDLDNEYKSRKVRPNGDAIDSEHKNTSPLDSFPPREDQPVVQKDFDPDECEAPSSLYVAEYVNTTASVDFESNVLLWLPPEPEDEEDDREGLFVEDDDDGIINPSGEWGYFRNSGSFGSSSYRNREKSNEEHKRAMKNVLDSHFRALVSQLLQVENIPVGDENDRESWLEIIMALSWEAATLLKPDMSIGGQMDPGGYVKVKCLASGRRSESMIVKGVVCKKNVAHRRMASKFEKARLLILGGALEYQRVSTALSSIDTLLQQEMDHLKMAVAKIDAHHPDVLLVEKSVSRYAQEYLLDKDISLVLNLKRPLLERIARCTGAQIVPSIDHLSSPTLGYCDMFHVEKFLEEHGSAGQNGKKLVKTLMYFEGCPKPLGCTILLRGANGDELKKVKHVVQYGVFAAYHLALETSFLADEGASLPVLPLESPITVALPDKSSNIDRSISIIPGFTLPEYQKVAGAGLQPPPRVSSVLTSDLVKATVESEYEKTSDILAQGPATSALSDGNVGPADISMYSEAKGLEADRLAAEEVCRVVNDLMDSHVQNVQNDSLDGDANRSIVSNSPSAEKQSQISEGRPTFKEEFPPPSDNQSILVSLSSRCVWKGTVCERAHLFRIKYYSNFDKPLGRFLRDDLFDQNYRCRSCDMPAEAHIQCYTHRQGTLTISVKKMQENNPLPGEKDGKVWMWHRCLKCPRADGMPPATRRIVMSDAAWGLSFGKFLELSFSNHAAASRVASCGHSLHRDCLRFYGFGKMVACFRYASINVHSVYLPPPKLGFNFSSQEWIEKELNKLVARVDLLFSEVHNALRLLVEKKCHISNAEALLQKEKLDFQESIHHVMEKEGGSYDIFEINRLWRRLVVLAYVWDNCLVNADSETKTKQVADSVVTSSDTLRKPEKPFDVPVLVKSAETLDGSSLTAVDAKPGQCLEHGVDPEDLNNRLLPDGHAPDCFPDAPVAVSKSCESNIVSTVADYSSDVLDEDTMSSSGTSFTNLYQLLNKNFLGGAQKLDAFRDYNPVYVPSFHEAELQGGARLLLPMGIHDTVVPVYDDEPTSIISYVLFSPEYNAQVSDKAEKLKDNMDAAPSLQSLHYGSFQLFHSFDETVLESFKSLGFGDEAAMSSSTSAASHHASLPADSAALHNLHPRVSFMDDGPLGKVKYTVTCYYAKQFESLRKMCCPSETDFVRSLSRCKKWGAQGGKSNVFFAKTLDDRFIIKQVTKTELESFIKFGTRYFQYLTESISSGSPTCLAKILGIYQVASKHLKGGKESKMDMLVMENLLFGRNVTRLYDLKGSARSRYNPDSSGSNKVLLDQNLIEAMPTSPIFVGNKAKRLLERAVWNDTAFLASIDVMDYSLLVGVDEEKHELVLGIIDFMRQYTWDKHLETWVKASGILGGSKNASPTVISPKQYKTRFRKAMTTYFLMVPDQWSPPTIIPSKSQTDLREAAAAANNVQTSSTGGLGE